MEILSMKITKRTKSLDQIARDATPRNYTEGVETRTTPEESFSGSVF